MIMPNAFTGSTEFAHNYVRWFNATIVPKGSAWRFERVKQKPVLAKAAELSSGRVIAGTPDVYR